MTNQNYNVDIYCNIVENNMHDMYPYSILCLKIVEASISTCIINPYIMHLD